MYRLSHCGTIATISTSNGNVTVYWSGYPPTNARERQHIELAVANVAADRNFNRANITCGIHSQTRGGRTQYAPDVDCEEHVTARFVNGNVEDMYYEGVTGHIFTTNGLFNGGYEIYYPYNEGGTYRHQPVPMTPATTVSSINPRSTSTWGSVSSAATAVTVPPRDLTTPSAEQSTADTSTNNPVSPSISPQDYPVPEDPTSVGGSAQFRAYGP